MKNLKGIALFMAFILIQYQHTDASSLPQNALIDSDNAIGRQIGNHALIDQDGKRFSLSEFRGIPIIISLVYTRCSHICPTITMSLRNAIKESKKDFGDKFKTITIGFDVENDTPARMKEYGGNFTHNFNAWIFATAERDTIDRLAKELGFYYKKREGGFDHLNVVTIIDGEGRIFKHIYGIDFKPEEIVGPISELFTDGRIASKIKEPKGLLDRLILFCYKYDPVTGTYKLDVHVLMVLLGIGASGFISLLVIYMIYGLRKEDRSVRRSRERRTFG